MNNIQSLIRGVVSTLLFAIGFAQTASRLDPLYNRLVSTDLNLATEPCVTPCHLA